MQKPNNHKSVRPIPPPLNQRFRRGLLGEKLNHGPQSKARIYFKPTHQGTVLHNADCSEYFEVENVEVENFETGVKQGTKQRLLKKKSPRVKDAVSLYPDIIPGEFHTALAHLEKHGSLTEKFLVNTLGGDGAAARKGRRFANKIWEWVLMLPFYVYIEQTAQGKEYRKK